MPPKRSGSTKAKAKERSQHEDTSEDELDQSPPPPTKRGKNKRQGSDIDHHEHKKPKNGKTINNGDRKKSAKWTEGDKERLAELGSDIDDATLGKEFPDHTIRSVKMMKTKMAPEATKKEKKEERAKAKKDKKEKKPEKPEKPEKPAKKAAATSKKKESPEVVVDNRTTAPKKQAKKKGKEPVELSSLSSDDHEEDEKASSDDGMSDIASHAEAREVGFQPFKGDLMSAEESGRAFDIYIRSPVRSQMWDLFRNLIIGIGGDDLKKYSREDWEWAFSNHFAKYVYSLGDQEDQGTQKKVDTDAEGTSHDEHDNDKDANLTQEVEMTH